ncbi:MAG: hypothetical protein ACXW32_01295 [Limisphaerales bacterium]
MEVETRAAAKFSIPSIIAIIAAIASFPVGAFFGFLLAMVAVVFGAIGIILALSSRVRGGMVSTLAILAGMLGIVAALVKGVAWLL